MDTYQFKLIEGNFSSQDAKTVLMSVINRKSIFITLTPLVNLLKTMKIVKYQNEEYQY